MGKNVSWFSTYPEGENRTTNYCLLTLKLIYEANQEAFVEVLSGLFERDLSGHFGVKFRQQEKKANGIPDGLIIQNPVQIFIETKHFDWFYSEQLERHLHDLADQGPGLKILLALGNFEGDYHDRFSSVIEICNTVFKNQIIFKASTFEEFLAAITVPNIPIGLDNAIHELRLYLDQSGLLPSWEKWLDVINCSTLAQDVLDGSVYMCPAEGGAYSHDRCKYFGMYRDKKVEKIAIIRAVVDVESEDVAKLLWNNSEEHKDKLLNEALAKLSNFRPGAFPTRVFLLGELFETEFIKETPYGLRGSKTYFNIEAAKTNDAQKLAHFLKGKNWGEIK